MARTTTRRPAAILLIVLVMLALFAIIGISFVLFAQAEATSANIHKQAFTDTSTGPPDPMASAIEGLRQMIYPVSETGLSVASAFRGHELARTMYGYCVNNGATNNVPYSGIGTFAENYSSARTFTYNSAFPNSDAATVLGAPLTTWDRRNVINYTANFLSDTVFDPEYTSDTARNQGQHIFGVGNPPTPVGRSPTSVYVGKNASYTYPDRNNAFLAMMDPDTGMIVMPSYHRPELFNTGNTTLPTPMRADHQLQSLDPGNPNWTNAQGRFMILRPRPFDHRYDSNDGRGLVSDFPYPQPNPDGTFTGDVQNYRYANGVQRNDSVWLHANLPPVLYRGKLLQPMIAPLILPLDGRVNLQVAGNRRGTGNVHNSHHGMGPYEQNAGKVLGTTGMPAGINGQNEAHDMTSYRYRDSAAMQPVGASGAAGNTTAYFENPQLTMSEHSVVNWRAISASPLPTPLTATYSTDPRLPTGWDNNGGPPSSGIAQQHQSLFNPYFLRDVNQGTGRIFSALDFRELGFRYSTKQSRYVPPLYGDPDQFTSLTGDAPQHPSGRARANTTPSSNSLNRPGLMPNFARMDNPGNYGLTATGISPQAPAPQQTAAQTFSATPPGATADTVTNQGYRSLAAALGPVDLNRPLADYRQVAGMGMPLSDTVNVPAMVSQAVPANRDRQVFAKDIFDRLVIATGAYCTGFDTVGRPTFTGLTPGTPAFNANRYLAQLAANIVDFIDSDDICTAFVWNPANAAGTTPPEQDPLNFQAATMGNNVVFGVEKPRLVLNEVYSEVGNAERDIGQPSATREFEVRFFIECVNPLNDATIRTSGNASSSAIGTGDAHLRIPPGPTGHSVYRFQVFQDGSTVHTQLYDPASNAGNVTGIPTGTPPRLQVTMPNSATVIQPNNGQQANTGFREFAPQNATNITDPDVYKPAPPLAQNVIQVPSAAGGPGPQNQLFYTMTLVRPDRITPVVMNQLNPGGNGRHAVLLQRLANPYLPESPTNPYITVDAMWDIRVNDAIEVGQADNSTTPPRPGTRQPGSQRPPLDQRQSRARKAPMYGYRGAAAANSYTQELPMTAPLTTRLRSHNDNARLLQPFEWLTHYDRKVTSPMELLHVAGVKPHELLHYFVANANAPAMPQPQDKHHHVAAWTNPNTNLARGLEMLTVKPWLYGIPVGGRQPGRINVNMIWHKDVLNALLDPQAGNSFTQADIDTLWTNLIAGGNFARTRNFPLVSSTTDEVTTPVAGQTLDRPIKSLGVASYAAGGLLPTGLSPNESILRNANPTNVPPPDPLAYTTDTTRHPVLKAEMLRKAANNLSTTTDTYMVLFTIGYFEIRKSPDPNGAGGTARYTPVLGREAYNEIPGDLRVQYGAIIDRSMLAVSPLPPTAGTQPQQAANVFFSELSGDVDPNSATGTVTIRFRCANTPPPDNVLVVNYEGQAIRIRSTPTSGSLGANETDVIVLGTGADAVYVRIANNPNISITIPSSNNGIGTITFLNNTYQPMTLFTNTPVAANARRKYYAGEAVGSAVPGNPGPQFAFDPNSPNYRQVVRDFFEIRP